MCAPQVTWHTSIRYSSCCHMRVNMLTRVWQQLEYRIDVWQQLEYRIDVWQQLEYRINVCHVTRGAHIEHL